MPPNLAFQARQLGSLLSRASGGRLRSCPPTSAWRLPSPPLLHCAGHPTPSTATNIAACEGIEDPNAAVVAAALWSTHDRPQHDGYGLFGVLYSASFWNGFQTVS
jgi:hypothetical protein